MTFYTYHDSPVGRLLLLSDGSHLTGLYMNEHKRGPVLHEDWRQDGDLPVLIETQQQLSLYFVGELRAFDLPLAPQGTPFQREVWNVLTSIPYGETISYSEMARIVDRPGAARAVGAANGANPLSIVVPCHRVVGAGKQLTGYAGGVERKQFLLALECERTK